MRKFEMRELHEAYDHADMGGQALHLHNIVFRNSPYCFRRDVDAGKQIGHLFDVDKDRLVATARRLGVRIIVVENEGTFRQHIDLCGAPLRLALMECK